jgi:hypothetical protein
MSVLAALGRDRPTADTASTTVRHTSLHTAVGVLLLALATAATAALVFGPARGARTDIGHVRTDLHASRAGIFSLLDRTTTELKTTERSLGVQKQGLVVASNAEQLTHTTTSNTTQLLTQTSAILTTIHQVVSSLGPLRQLRGDLGQVTRQVTAGVALAHTTLTVAEQTLRTGRNALAVAGQTLSTLRDSRSIQQQLLDVARQTLQQTIEINRKIPALLAVNPTTSGGSDTGALSGRGTP